MSTARKLPDPNAKKRVKFISSKVQPVYRPRRSRCDPVNTTDRETGGRKVEFSEDLMTPAPRKGTVNFTKIAVGEVRPPRSRTRVKHDAPMLSHPPRPQVTSPMKKIPDCQKQAQTHWKPRQPRTQKPRGETIPKRIRPPTPVKADIPKQRSRIQREQPIKSSSTPVQNETSSRDAAIATRNNNPACICPRKNYPRNSRSSAPGPRPTRERPVPGSAAPPNRYMTDKLTILIGPHCVHIPRTGLPFTFEILKRSLISDNFTPLSRIILSPLVSEAVQKVSPLN